jgi:mannose-6-phosphate isomerase-like protein (cupin superfamily)
MQTKRLGDARRFAPEKMVKAQLFATERLFCDVYCLLPGQAQKVHSHAASDKVYLVLSGTARVTLGDEEADLGPEETVLCPAGVAHGVANLTSEPVTLLVIITPPPTH